MLTAVGDAVHVLPVVTAIKRRSPTTRITWILQPGPASLVRGHPDVDEVLVFERKRGWRAFAELRRTLRHRHFDVVLAMQQYFKAGLITAMTRAPRKIGFDRARSRDGTWLFANEHLTPRGERHFQDQYLEFAEAIGVDPQPLTWNLGPWASEIEYRDRFVAQLSRPAATIVVATSKPDKDWPADRWADVCDALDEEFGLQPVLVGGLSPRELAAVDEIRSRARRPVLSTLGTTLRELVAILDASAVVLSPDTGPLHIAVALNRPTIALMGYTNPLRVGPYRRFQDLVIDAYGEPGEQYTVSRENRPGRMTRITVQQVIEKLRIWRERYAPR
jgi:heptosyltransferase I